MRSPIRIGPLPLVIEDSELQTEATGTREQLLDAGLCTPAQFPEGRKRRAWGQRAADDDPMGPVGWSLEAMGGGRWHLIIPRTGEEHEAWLRRDAAPAYPTPTPQRLRAPLVLVHSA